MNCSALVTALKLLQYIYLIIGSALASLPDLCKLPKHLGSPCESESLEQSPVQVVRWYYNETANGCFAFGFRGCGVGNENNFESLQQCRNVCMDETDQTTCAPSMTPYGRVVHGIFECRSDEVVRVTWYGGFVCCNRDSEELFIKASGTCNNGSVPELTRTSDYFTTLVGDSCDDLPCRGGYHCEQISIFAKCCPMNISNTLNEVDNNTINAAASSRRNMQLVKNKRTLRG